MEAASVAPHVCYGDPALAPCHSAIIQYDVQRVYVVKTREYYCFYFLLATQRRGASSTMRRQTNTKLWNSCHPNEPLTTTPALRDRRSYPLEMGGGACGDWWRRLRRKHRLETLVRCDASSTNPCAARQTPSCYPPAPYYYLIVVYYEQWTATISCILLGLVTPYYHRGTPPFART